MAEDPLSLLVEITRATRAELREHRHDDNTRLDRIDARLGQIEQHQARATALEEARRQGEVRRAGIVAAVTAGVIGLFGQAAQYFRH
jgi:hypothetical protein